uniref:Uncharacterized protein n=1 Tax=Ditylenchus dipsaci TaxID=166011 RepID=A0A915DBP5_9BILA
MLVIGWTSGVWIISAKTLQSWRRAFCCCFCCCMDDEAVNRRQGYYPAMAQEDMMHHQPSVQQHHQHPSSIQYNDMNKRHYHHHQLMGQYGAEVLYSSQRQQDSMASPMTYANSNGTLRHCQAMHSAAIMPENV